MKTHDRDYFYKYLTPETGKIILSTLSMWWSSPLAFNDPFDTQTKLRFDIPTDDLANAVLKESLDLIFGEAITTRAPHSTGYRTLLLLFQQNQHRMTREKIIHELSEASKESSIGIAKVLDELNEEWKEFVKKSRVLCVTEEHDNLLMWAHYANDHKGLVIQLKCLPEHDTALCAAQPIKYTDAVPAMFTSDAFIKDLTGQEMISSRDELFTRQAYTKSDHWSYEKEWRCITKTHESRTVEDTDYDANGLLSKEINSVYLGLKMTEQDKEEIKSILEKDKFKHVNIYEAKMASTTYSLDFEQIR